MLKYIGVWFGLVWLYGVSTIVGYLMPNSFLYIYIKYIWFSLVGFYVISTIVGYLMPNALYMLWIKHFIHIYWIHKIWFGWDLWHINNCRLFNAKSSLDMYTKYIRFSLVWFYSISTIVGYLMPNPLYIYIYIYIYITGHWPRG